jgi:hypothetical protein
MAPIKLILILSVSLIAFYVYKKNKFFRVKRSVLLLIYLSCITVIIFPDLTTIIAHHLGVRRGVDLLFYFAFLMLFFLALRLYKKMKSIEKQVTLIIRDQALQTLKKMKN